MRWPTQSSDESSNEGCHAFKVGGVVEGFGNHQGCQAHRIAEPGSVDAAGQEEGHVHEHARQAAMVLLQSAQARSNFSSHRVDINLKSACQGSKKDFTSDCLQYVSGLPKQHERNF